MLFIVSCLTSRFHSEEDLYRAAEEIEQEKKEKQLSNAGIKAKTKYTEESKITH